MEPSTNGDNEVRPPRPWRIRPRTYVVIGLVVCAVIMALVLFDGQPLRVAAGFGIPLGLLIPLIVMALTGDIESFGNMFWRR